MYEALTSSLIRSIAEHKSVDPDELDIIVADYIDIAAVEQLARHSNSTWSLEFELPSHSVTVHSDGRVLVDGQVRLNWISD
ncbi:MULTISPECIES: HalOD1 output domain-containing protein [unclassified Halorubrum]|uniref:HalOD1 output domain-containing protein n=1 Tax=unclassified Halorubrum TaxID=2642239 RepID=UPI0011C4A385|nr:MULTISPECIES: HalOD1 output domain-containing protein [unclassified Halorubrum]